MEQIFLSVLNMSLTGAFVVAVICLARLPLKKAPKSISYALWAVAGFRLVFPFSIRGIFSLLPFKSAPIPQDIAMQAVPRIDSGITSIDNAVSSVLPAATPMASMNPLQGLIAIGSFLWLLGAAVMLLYSFVSIILLNRRLYGAALIDGNLYEAEQLKTPFVIGFFHPKIYIPAGLSGEERRYIVLHEQTHIKRHDHLVKMFAYLVLCLHWFNPMAWVAFVLMGADMEMSCDERVLRALGGEIKNAYSLSLVRMAAQQTILNGSPLAFGEGGMKARIKNVLRFKKYPRTSILAAVSLSAVLIAGFAVNRVGEGGSDPASRVPASGTYYLVNPTQKQKLERLSAVTLYDNGRAWLNTPPISSYLLPDCAFSVSGDELTIHAVIATQAEEGFFGIENGAVLARFAIAGERTLVFQSDSVPVFADKGAQYVLSPDLTAGTYEARVWLDCLTDDQLLRSGSAELELFEYPGVTFKWTPEKLTAAGPDGEVDLFQGMPIWNVYLADLTGDGRPELYATVSIGSGMIDERILAYDPAAGKGYTLSDRGYYDYSLFTEKGLLMVKQTTYPAFQGEPLATGELAIVESELTAIGVDRARPES